MDLKNVRAVLQANRPELERHGVLHAALFGSTARGDAGPDSDIDIMVDLDPGMALSVYDYVGVKEFIASLFAQPVDVVNLRGLKPEAGAPAARDAVYAF